jgi:maltose O-acetyltransferase
MKSAAAVPVAATPVSAAPVPAAPVVVAGSVRAPDALDRPMTAVSVDVRETTVESLRKAGAHIGARVSIHATAYIDRPEKLTIGDDVQIGPRVTISGEETVRIGDRTIIGTGATILSSNHQIPDGARRIFDAGLRSCCVSIAEDAWIGPHAVVMPFVTVGMGAVIGAGCVANSDVWAYKVVGGNPMQFERNRR